MSKDDCAKVGAAEAKLTLGKKTKTTDRAGKLKSSAWYQGAARSIGIAKDKSFEK
jgi:hypothetical protein